MRTTNHKITLEHLKRKAIVYLRQSSIAQVRENQESQRLQYALADRARRLGWQDVEIIDSDLGVSASRSSSRAGFEQLVSAVALDRIGIVLAREASRLSRTDKDWCHLLEVCQAFRTLIGDEEHIYDLDSIDDQLVLGIKGTMSVVELKVLKMRMLEGREAKARRGEYFIRLPPGYVLDGAGHLVLDPDERVREAISLIFHQYRQLWSVRKTAHWFRDEGIRLPVNHCVRGRVQLGWQLPKLSFIYDVLTNPFYAGAYFYGRGTTKTVVKDGKLAKRCTRPPRRAEECRVFIWDHHEGYIDRRTYEENQERMRRTRLGDGTSVAPVRGGHGLLAGLLRCGHCGRRLYVRYWGRSGAAARYYCGGDYAEGGNYCLAFGGAKVDRRVSQEILQVISPLGIDASVEALERMRSRYSEQGRSLDLELQQRDFEVQRAYEQYDQVDPRNRLVASELEKRWNVKLEERDKLRSTIADLEIKSQPLSSEDEQKIRDLGENFTQVWDSENCPIELKKKIVHTLIEEIVASLKGDTICFIIHWKGGVHTELEMPRSKLTSSQATPPEALEIIRKMAARYGDDQIAAVLNKNGLKTGTNLRWTQMRVAAMRHSRGIPGQCRTLEDPEILSLAQAARYCNVNAYLIRRMVEDGIVTNRQAVPMAPWELRRDELDSEPVRQVLERYRRTGKYPASGGDQPHQLTLID